MFIEPLETLLRTKHGEISAMLIEPIVLGAGGMIMYPPEYLKEVSRLMQLYGVHLIADEIAVGFGRTGKMFACEHADISPDFMCVSKGLTSGTLPISVTLTTAEIYESFLDDNYIGKTFFHGHTYTANPIACAAANATLDVFKKESLLQNVVNNQEYFKNQLLQFEGYDLVTESRAIGFIGALELKCDRETMLLICRKALENNMLLRPIAGVLYLYLPLVTTNDQIDDIYYRLNKVFNDII